MEQSATTKSSSDPETPPVVVDKDPAPSADANRADGNGNGNGGDTDWSAGRLSAVEAEAFADAIRPSWGDAEAWGAPQPEEKHSPAVSPAVVPVPEPKAMEADEPIHFDPVPAAVPVVVHIDDEPTVLPGASGSGKKLAAVAVIFVLAIVVVIVSFTGGGEPPEPTTTARAETPETPATMTAAATVTESEAATTETEAATTETEAATETETTETDPVEALVMVRIQTRTVPPNARLELDGVRVGNPFDREVERDGTEHVLRASADGFQTLEQRLSWTGPYSTVIELEREAPEPAPMVETPTPMVAVAPMTTRMRQSMRASMRRTMRASMRRSMRASMRRSGFTTANPY